MEHMSVKMYLVTLLTLLDTLGLQVDINIKQLGYETV